MYKMKNRMLTLLACGVMLSNTVTTAYAENGGPGVVSNTEATTENAALISPGDSVSGTSPVITVSPKAETEAENPAETSAVITVPTVEEAAAEAAGNAAADEQTGGELSSEAMDELSAEQQAAAEEAANLNNPLTVPERIPRFSTTVLVNQNVQWIGPYLADQAVNSEGLPFCSVSTYLEGIFGNLLYRVYTSSHGWTQWVMNGQQTPRPDGWPAIEAIEYRLAGIANDQYDVWYCTTLSDGTQTGWVKNGEAAGTMNKGLYMTGFTLKYVKKGEDPLLDTTNSLVSDHADGVQYIDGALRYINGNGSNHTGWGWVGNERYYFVDSVPVTGWQYIDGYKYYFYEDGRLCQDVESVLGKDGPYIIQINKQMNCLTIYTTDENGNYVVPVKSFLTSVGDDTPTGTFRTPEKIRWQLMIHDVYTQYATRLGKGLHILMHSILYDAPNPYTVWASTYNNMGIARSAGCIRLVTSDSKWIYDHCPVGTQVTIYNSGVPGPFERPCIAYEIPFEQTWDPTDPNVTEEGIAAETQRIINKFN